MYIIHSSLILAVFYLLYKLLCSRDTLHRFNRGLLLLILALSAVLPFIHIDLPTISQEASAVFEELTMTIEPTEIVASEAGTTEQVTPTPWQQFPWHAVFIGIYIIGLAVCLARFVSSLLFALPVPHRTTSSFIVSNFLMRVGKTCPCSIL